MGLHDWSLTPAENGTIDPAIPAAAGTPARDFPRATRAMMAALRRLIDAQGGALVTGGTLNAYTVNPGFGMTELRRGISLTVTPDRSNTAQATLNMDGLGPLPWTDASGAPLAASALIEGRIYPVYLAQDDAGAFVWRVQAGSTAISDIPGLVALQQGVAADRTAVATLSAGVTADRAAVAGDRAAAQTARDQAQASIGYGRFVVDTRAQLALADALSRPDGSIAEVMNDPAAVTATAGNGTYVKVGAPNAGTYAKRSDVTLPAVNTVANSAAISLDILYSEIATKIIPFRSFRVAGNASPGDAGANALYVRGATGPRKITDASGTSFVLVLEGGTANVGHFGAIGDGAANDAPAVNAAFAASPRVFVPRGTFLCDAFLVVPVTGATLIGAGRDLTKIKLGTGVNGLIGANGRSDVVIEGIHFIGRKDTPAGASLISFPNSTRIAVNRCRFEGTRHTAAAFGPATNSSGLDDCQFYDCGYFNSTNDNSPAWLFHGKLSTDTDDQSIEKNFNNYIRNCYIRNGMTGLASRQKKFTFEENDFVSDGSAGTYFSLIRGLRVLDSLISSPGPNGDTSQGGNGLDIINCSAILVQGNEINNCGAAGVMLAYNISDAKIIGNTFYDNCSSPVSLHRGGCLSVDLSIAGTVQDGILVSDNDAFDTRAGSPSVTQLNAIANNGTVATLRNFRVTNDNRFRGYLAATGEESITSIFQRPIFPVTEHPQWFNMASGTTRDLADSVVNGVLCIQQYNGLIDALIKLRPSTLATPGQLTGSTLLTRAAAFNGPTANFSTTNEVAFTVTLGDGTASTVRLNAATLAGAAANVAAVTPTEFVNAVTAQMTALSGKVTAQLDAVGRLSFTTVATGTGTTALVSLQNVTASSGKSLVDVGFGISTVEVRSNQGKAALSRTPNKLVDATDYFVLGAANAGTTFAVYTTSAGKHVLANNSGTTRLIEISLLAGSRFAA